MSGRGSAADTTDHPRRRTRRRTTVARMVRRRSLRAALVVAATVLVRPCSPRALRPADDPDLRSPEARAADEPAAPGLVAPSRRARPEGGREATPLASHHRDALTPSAIPARGPVRVAGTVTNTDSVPWLTVNVYSFISEEPMTTRAQLAAAVRGRRVAPPSASGSSALGSYDTIETRSSPASPSRSPSPSTPSCSHADTPGVYWFGVHALGSRSGEGARRARARRRPGPDLPAPRADPARGPGAGVGGRPAARHARVRRGRVARRPRPLDDDPRRRRPAALAGRAGRDRGRPDRELGRRPCAHRRRPPAGGRQPRPVPGGQPRRKARRTARTTPPSPRRRTGPARRAPRRPTQPPPTPRTTPATRPRGDDPAEAELAGRPGPGDPGAAADAAREWLGRLRAAMDDNDEVLALPYGDLDVSAAARHDRDGLRAGPGAVRRVSCPGIDAPTAASSRRRAATSAPSPWGRSTGTA